MKMRSFIKLTVVFGIFFLVGWGLVLLFSHLSLYFAIPILVLIIIGIYFINRKNIWAMKGNVAYLKRDFDGAKIVLKKAIDANVRSSLAYLYYATIILREGENISEAFAMLEKAKKYQKSVIEERTILLTLGTSHWLNGNVPEGIRVLEDLRARHAYVNESVLTTLGYMYMLAKDYDKAEEITNLALAIEPDYAAAIDNLGQIAYQKEDYEAAKLHFEKALSFRENLADSNYFLGLIYEKSDDNEKAQEYFKKASICEITAFNTITLNEIEAKLVE